MRSFQRFLFIIMIVCAGSTLCTSLFAQDTIVTRNQVIIPAKVIEIDESSVRYKKTDNLTGPDYVISRKKIDRILYENGKVDKLNQPDPVQTMQKDYYGWKEGHTTISMAITDLVFGVVSLQFERTFLRDHLAIRVPVSAGFNALGHDTITVDYNEGFFSTGYSRLGFYNRNKVFSTGLDVLAFPFERSKVNYFVGMAFEYGQFNFYAPYYYNYQMPSIAYSRENCIFYGALIKNGIEIQPSKHFVVTGNLAVGISKVETKIRYNYSAMSEFIESLSRAVEANICVGYRF